MKQRIDTSQLQQLNPSQQEKLREWWNPKEGDFAIRNFIHEFIVAYKTNDNRLQNVAKDCGCSDCCISYGECLPLLSIGQCIELLQEISHKHLYEDIWMHTEHKPQKAGGWGWKWYCGHGDYNQYDSEELIDALFETVKSIL